MLAQRTIQVAVSQQQLAQLRRSQKSCSEQRRAACEQLCAQQMGVAAIRRHHGRQFIAADLVFRCGLEPRQGDVLPRGGN